MTEQAKKIIVGFMVVSVLVATLLAIPRLPRPSLPTENEPYVVTPVPEEDGVMCTMEVKLCPDGSAVGRSGLNCEFAQCPSEVVSTSGKTFFHSVLGIKFQHDEALSVSEDASDQVRLWKWGPTQRGQTELYDGMIITFRAVSILGMTSDEYALSKLREIEGVGTITAPLTDRMFAGRSAKTYSVSGLGDFPVILVPIAPDRLLEITTMAPDPTGAGFQREVEQLLSTMVFTL